ncbi:MAG: hypothetical protein IJJ99_00435 [Oscillospiraceae bacterium]|nr:hypothetical protein [Oscillospiraceae bacterium]
MKKQGEFYLKLTSILLAALLAIFVLFSIFLRSGEDYTTLAPVYCEVGDGITVSGFVVRSEELLVSSAPYPVAALAEGQRVGGSQTVAYGCATEDAARMQRELLALQIRRDRLAFASESAKDLSAADAAIAANIIRLSAQTAAQSVPRMQAAAAALEPYVLQRSLTPNDAARVQARLSNLDAEIAALQAQCAASSTPITVSQAGYSSRHADGFEDVLTPEALQTMSLSELRSVETRRAAVPEHTIGRLIFGQKWYLVCELPAGAADRCAAGDSLLLTLAGEELTSLPVQIERLVTEEDGASLLVVSCAVQMQDVTALRAVTATLNFRTYEGLRVPKEAVRTEDGETGVYVLIGAKARWKPVEILFIYDEYCLIRQEPDGLREDDAVILTDEEIRDGSVIAE